MHTADKRATGYHVSFSSKFGSGKGAWDGETPIEGYEYSVDIECGEVFTWGGNIHPASGKTCHIRSERDMLRVTGLLECVDADGIAHIHLNGDVISLETRGIPPRPDTYVEFRTSDVTLSDNSFTCMGMVARRR